MTRRDGKYGPYTRNPKSIDDVIHRVEILETHAGWGETVCDMEYTVDNGYSIPKARDVAPEALITCIACAVK